MGTKQEIRKIRESRKFKTPAIFLKLSGFKAGLQSAYDFCQSSLLNKL